MKSTPKAKKEPLCLVRRGEDLWCFEYGGLTKRFYDTFHDLLDQFDASEDVEAELRGILRRHPEFIDGWHHLALFLRDVSRRAEARECWEIGVETGLRVFPAEFERGKHTLPWEWLDNRPFLRSYFGVGLSMYEQGEALEALQVFNDILSMDPNDHQGARFLIVRACLHMKHPELALSTCRQFPEDGSEDLMYGRVLAFLQKGDRREAGAALRSALRHLPLVAKELVKKTHRMPPSVNPDYITHGGTDQAFLYWESSGDLWRRTPGAIAFLEEHLRRPPPQAPPDEE